MRDLLSMIYDEVANEDREFISEACALESNIPEQVSKLNLDEDKEQAVKDLMYEYLGKAQMQYFKTGFKYGIRLVVECGSGFVEKLADEIKKEL